MSGEAFALLTNHFAQAALSLSYEVVVGKFLGRAVPVVNRESEKLTLLETELQDKLLLKNGVKSVVYRFSLVDKQPTVSVLHVENTEGVGLGEDVHVSEVGAADTQLHSRSGSGGR